MTLLLNQHPIGYHLTYYFLTISLLLLSNNLPSFRICDRILIKLGREHVQGIAHTPDTLGTLPDIAANARPLRAWLKCRTITTHARESVADLSRNCKGFRARESVHARVTKSRAQGTGVGRDIRQSPSRVRSVFLLIYGIATKQTSLWWWWPLWRSKVITGQMW